MTADEVEEEEEGLEVSTAKGNIRQVQQQIGIDRRTGEAIYKLGTEYRDGDISMVPDPGWSYNPGAEISVCVPLPPRLL